MKVNIHECGVKLQASNTVSHTRHCIVMATQKCLGILLKIPQRTTSILSFQCFAFSVIQGNFSVTWRRWATGCVYWILWSQVSVHANKILPLLKPHVPDTRRDTPLTRIMLTLGQPVPFLCPEFQR